MHMLQRLATILGALVIGATAVQAKDTLVIGVAQFPASLHPYISSQTVQFYTIGFATRPISAFNVEGKPVCLLCAELPTIENGLAKIEELPNGGRGLAVTIKLKPDLTWGDGVPLTARDIAFTWKMGIDPAAGFSNIYNWSRAKSVDVIDDHTAVLHLDRTIVTYQLWDYVLPEHLEGPTFKASANMLDYINHTAYNAAPLTKGLWNGPYIITGYQSGNAIELGLNPEWKGEKPAIPHIVIRLVENTAALQANLLSGDIDMTPSGIGITTDQAVAMQKDHPDGFQFIYRPGLSLERIDWQRDNKLLADIRVRQALMLSIDRKTLIERLFGGHAKLALSWINELEPNYITDVATYAYDPARAKALLAEAGFTPGPDGVCRNAGGDRLSFDFTTTAGNKVRELSQQVMQSQWKAICVEVLIKNQPSRQFFGETTRKRLYPGLAEYANSSRIGLPPTPFYATSAIPTEANNFAGLNYAGFSNPRMDALLVQAETELDPAKQKVLWAEMQKIYAADLSEFPLYFREDPDVAPIWIRGYEATGKEDYVSYWAEKWK